LIFHVLADGKIVDDIKGYELPFDEFETLYGVVSDIVKGGEHNEENIS